MEKSDIFEALVRYHFFNNLLPNLHRVVNGRLVVEGNVPEGMDKNQVNSGALVIADGETLVDRLISDEVVLDEPDELEAPVPIPSTTEFFQYLNGMDGEDGAYIFDSQNRRILQVHELNNNPKKLKKIPLSYLVPADFVHYKPENAAKKQRMGTKTRNAARAARAYDADAFQIKRSRYTDLGFGKVTHFTIDGLAEEFFFKYEPEGKVPLLLDEPGLRIAGVYRRYEPKDGGIQGVFEQDQHARWDPNDRIILPGRNHSGSGLLHVSGPGIYLPNGEVYGGRNGHQGKADPRTIAVGKK